MLDFIIQFRCFTGPGYWGAFKHTKAFDLDHANQKIVRIQTAYFAKHGEIGEFRVVEMTGEQLRLTLLSLGSRKC